MLNCVEGTIGNDIANKINVLSICTYIQCIYINRLIMLYVNILSKCYVMGILLIHRVQLHVCMCLETATCYTCLAGNSHFEN